MPTISITAIQQLGEEYALKKKAWEALEKAGVPIPGELIAYFGGKRPIDPMRDFIIVLQGQKTDEIVSGSSYGYYVQLSKLPEKATHIRVQLHEDDKTDED